MNSETILEYYTLLDSIHLFYKSTQRKSFFYLFHFTIIKHLLRSSSIDFFDKKTVIHNKIVPIYVKNLQSVIYLESGLV